MLSFIRLLIGVILVFAVLLIAGCGEVGELDPASSGVSPTSTTGTVSSSESNPTPTSAAAAATSMPEEPEPPTKTADSRLSGRNEYGVLVAWLESIERHTFAGGFIEQEPEHRYVVFFTENAEQTLDQYVMPGSELDEFIEIRSARFSFDDLWAAQAEVDQIFRDLGFFPPDSTINIINNRLEYPVGDPELVGQALTNAGITIPETVGLISGGGSLVSLDAPVEIPGIYIAILKPQPPVDRDGEFNEYTGTLVLEDGCLWIVLGLIGQRAMPIWSGAYRLQVEGDSIAVINSSGVVVARVGEPIYMNGTEFDQDHFDREKLYNPIPNECQPERVLDVISIDPLDHQPDMVRRAPEYSPFDLFSAQWPASYAEAEALVSRLPEHLGEPGMDRWIRHEDSGRVVVGYGPESDPGAPRLTITDLTTGAYFPDYWTVNDLIASQLMIGTGRDAGFSQETSWALEDTSVTGRVDRYGSVPMHALTWGSNNGRVLFVAAAADYAQLEMIVAAVVAVMD